MAETINISCHHCSDICSDNSLEIEGKYFCCNGCLSVYQILNEFNLGKFYDMPERSNAKATSRKQHYDFLDDEELASSFVLFKDKNVTKVRLHLPQIHCTACIWLLENINRIHDGVTSSQVNFSKRTADIFINTDKISFHELAVLLEKIGYPPTFDIDNGKAKHNRIQILKIGVAGFGFGNVMLYAFPEYLGMEETRFQLFFSALSFAISLVVVFYSGGSYLKSAYKSIVQKKVNLDVPIAIGILTLLIRSMYEIFVLNEAGYSDSLCGFVFFLLIGKWFQSLTYSNISFERDYKSYFPLSILVKKGEEWISTKLSELNEKNHVKIRSNEIIPADGVLLSEDARIDYSFVTGESDIIRKKKGALIYAGGRIVDQSIELIISKNPDNSYLTSLWANSGKKDEEKEDSLIDVFSSYFTYIIIIIALITAFVWSLYDPSEVWSITTSVLIVACPCALALSSPFTMGNMMRLLRKKEIYVKDVSAMESIIDVQTLFWDKTGTLMATESKRVNYSGKELSDEQKIWIKSLASESNHPLSRAIAQSIKTGGSFEVTNFKNKPGEGISGEVAGFNIELKKPNENAHDKSITSAGSRVAVYFDNYFYGTYIIAPTLRPSVAEMINNLEDAGFHQELISGDNDLSREYLNQELSFDALHFNCSPEDKMNLIVDAQKEQKVAMIGDGLNDAGALMKSDIGIAITEDSNYFVPACDVIMHASQVKNLDKVIATSKAANNTLKVSFIFSILYNLTGLIFAITGNLSPIVAAILMPLSSVTIVAFCTVSTNLKFGKIFN